MANAGGRYDKKPTYVYRASDAAGSLLYVGITHDPDQRLKSHRYKAQWWKDASRMEWLLFPNRRAALDAEREVIDTEHPSHNVTWEEIAAKRQANKRRLDAWREQVNSQMSKAHGSGVPCGISWCRDCSPAERAS